MNTTHAPLVSLPIRRLAAVALLIVVIGLIHGVAIQPIVEEFSSYADSIATAEETLPRFERVAATLPRVKARYAELREQFAAAGGFLSGTNESLAGAALQTRIKQLVEESGAELRSTQILPGREESRFRRITVRVNMTGGTEALRKLWHAMESNPQFLFIDNFDVRGRAVRRQRNQPEEIVALDVRFDAVGFIRGEPK